MIRNLRTKSEKEDLETRLDKCKAQLHLQLTQTSTLNVLRRLDLIVKSGKFQETELYSLTHNFETLRHCVDATRSHLEGLDDIRQLLQRSGTAIDKVLQKIIVDLPGDETLTARYDVVTEAHEATFGWLLDEPSETSANSTASRPTTSFCWYDKDVECLKEARARLSEWLEAELPEGQSIFHISGKPGAGKSTDEIHLRKLRY